MVYKGTRFGDIIKNSHMRCKENNISEEKVFPDKILEGEELNKTFIKNQTLIEKARPIIKILYELLKDSGFIIDLTDSHGYILSLVGDSSIVEQAADMGMVVGTDMSEESVGTNAIGTALYENTPIQMAEKEHYIKAYHVWTCSASPIHDTKGNIIGCLNLTGRYNLVHSHTLGLAVAAANAIENSFKSEEYQKKVSKAYQQLYTIISSIEEALLLVNKDGKVEFINKKASEALGIGNDDIEIKIEEVFDNWKDIYNSIVNNDEYKNMEFSFIKNKKKRTFNLNAFPVKDDKKLTGIIIILKDIKNVYGLVNKYSDHNAYYTFDDIEYCSVKINEIISYAKTVADTPFTILIQGESGTGKEVFAQAIHNYSQRAEHPFISVNCGSIPRNLIESELFGYEDGTFTGAKKGGMPGKFEIANYGTIFLDEIGEMPLDMQVHLLRVLQERCVTRIGGTRCIATDVRVIAATNKNLTDAIKKGTFREDLYYRLCVFPISIPPLKERKEDIQIIAKNLISKKAKRLNIEPPKMKDEQIQKLMDYSWPGNIRELENKIENYMINGKILLDPENDSVDLSKNKSDEYFRYEMQTLEEWEKIAFNACLKKCNGNISKTAKILNVDRSTIYKKMLKYDIQMDKPDS